MMMTLPDERQAAIRVRLGTAGRVVAADLAREFQTSEDTIRRDLRELAAAGLCRRVYGGALPLSRPPATLPLRNVQDQARKQALGAAAAALVDRSGLVVLIDAGSTNRHIAEQLPPDLALTVVTNAPTVAAALGERPGCEVIVLGGRVDAKTGGCIGAAALDDLGRIRADVCFLGACAADPNAGVTVFDAEEAVFKRAMAARSERTIVALTTDKLTTLAPFGVMPLTGVADLVVEADAPGAEVAAFAAAGPRVHRAGECAR